MAAPDFVPVPDLSKYLTSDNLAKLADGDIVKENIMEKDAAGNDKGRGVALIMIDAPPDKVMAALDSFETYPSWMPNTKQTKVVKREGNRVDVEFELSIVGSQVTYTCIHEVNKDAGTVRWRMDDAKPKKNVADSVGAWVVKAHGDGKSIVAYTVAVDTGMSVPKFIQNWLTNTSLKKVVKSVRDKVEGK
ncbi:MAG: SRPBCC family protein [Deltaproteobacteria bacterium]|nr:SRPBCC family protein [Deltaproteobacteria bacterium]